MRFGDPDLVAMGIHLHGIALIDAGRVAEGMALLDEAMTSVVAGELGTFFTGVVYWPSSPPAWRSATSGGSASGTRRPGSGASRLPADAPFPAICRVNRAEAASLGAPGRRRRRRPRVTREMRFNPRVAARAFYETGEIRRRVGNLAGAEEAFARAHELGFQPQPGLALLRLAQGKPDAALRALRAAVADEPAGQPRRARLLAAQVEAALAAGDLDAAGQAGQGSTRWPAGSAPALAASAATAGGALRLAAATCRAPWRACAPPARPGRSCGSRMRPRRPGCCTVPRCAVPAARRTPCWSCARPWPRSSGSVPPATWPGRPRHRWARGCPRGLTAREAEVLRLVAAGRTSREVAAVLVISEHTVARHLQNIFAKLGVSSRSAATAFAFEHGLA